MGGRESMKPSDKERYRDSNPTAGTLCSVFSAAHSLEVVFQCELNLTRRNRGACNSSSCCRVNCRIRRIEAGCVAQVEELCPERKDRALSDCEVLKNGGVVL